MATPAAQVRVSLRKCEVSSRVTFKRGLSFILVLDKHIKSAVRGKQLKAFVKNKSFLDLLNIN